VKCSFNPPAQPRRSQTLDLIICFSKADRWSEGEKNNPKNRKSVRERERERGRLFERLLMGELIGMKKKNGEKRLCCARARRIVSQISQKEIPNRARGHNSREREREREG